MICRLNLSYLFDRKLVAIVRSFSGEELYQELLQGNFVFFLLNKFSFASSLTMTCEELALALAVKESNRSQAIDILRSISERISYYSVFKASYLADSRRLIPVMP